MSKEPSTENKAIAKLMVCQEMLKAKSTELAALKAFVRDEVLCEIYNQHGQNTELIRTLRAKVSCENTVDHPR